MQLQICTFKTKSSQVAACSMLIYAAWHLAHIFATSYWSLTLSVDEPRKRDEFCNFPSVTQTVLTLWHQALWKWFIIQITEHEAQHRSTSESQIKQVLANGAELILRMQAAPYLCSKEPHPLMFFQSSLNLFSKSARFLPASPVSLYCLVHVLSKLFLLMLWLHTFCILWIGILPTLLVN